MKPVQNSSYQYSKKLALITGFSSVFLTSMSNAAGGQDTQSSDVRIYPVKLGTGIDVETGDIKSTFNIDENNFIVPGDQIAGSTDTNAVQYTGIIYNDAAVYTGDVSASSKLKQMSFQGGISGSYGLFSGSVKAGFEKNSASASGQATITKSAGIIIQRKAYLPVLSPITDASIDGVVYEDKFNLNSLALNATAAALYHGVGGLKAAVDKIRMAKTLYERQQAVLEFRQNFGTHAVVGVTLATIANTQARFKQTTSTSSDAWRTNAEASFSSPFVGGSAAGSYMDANKISAQNWDLDIKTLIVPYNSAIYASLQSVYNKINSEYSAAKSDSAAVMDLNKISYPNVDLPASIPGLTDIPKPSLTDAQKKQLEKEKTQRIVAQNDLASLNAANNEIRRLIASDNIEAVKERVAAPIFKDKLKTYLDSLNGTGTGLYKDLVFSPQDLEVILEARQYADKYATFQTETVSNDSLPGSDYEVLKNARAQNISANTHLFPSSTTSSSYHNEKLNFKSWLATKAYYTECGSSGTGCKDFNTWYASLSPTVILRLQDRWIADINPDESVAMYNLLHQNGKLNTALLKQSNVRARSKPFTSTDDTTPVVVNFSIVPWAVIFKDLSVNLVQDGSQLVQAKIISQIDSFISDENYLKLAASFNYDGAQRLLEMYNADKKGILSPGTFNSLIDLRRSIVASLDNQNPVISYMGYEYDLTDANKLDALISTISTQMANSAMQQSSWYVVVSELKKQDLLSPTGAFLAFNLGKATPNGYAQYPNYKEASLFNLGGSLGLINLPWQTNGDLRNRLVSNEVPLARQLTNFLKYVDNRLAPNPAGPVFPHIIETVLPIVTASSQLVNGYFSDLNYLSSTSRNNSSSEVLIAGAGVNRLLQKNGFMRTTPENNPDNTPSDGRKYFPIETNTRRGICSYALTIRPDFPTFAFTDLTIAGGDQILTQDNFNDLCNGKSIYWHRIMPGASVRLLMTPINDLDRQIMEDELMGTKKLYPILRVFYNNVQNSSDNVIYRALSEYMPQ